MIYIKIFVLANLLSFCIAFFSTGEASSFRDKQAIEYYNQTQIAIAEGRYPPQEETIIDYPPFVLEIAICDDNWHCDLKIEYKHKLASIIKNYPQTQAFIKKNEGWVDTRYNEVGGKKKYAIGFGDNKFINKNPQVKKISEDLGNFLMIEHIASDQPKVKAILKNQPEAWCPAIRTVISDIIYQYGGTGFEKTEQTRNVYSLSVDGFIKNWDKIKRYLKRNPYKLRNKLRIELIEEDECFQKARIKYLRTLSKPKQENKTLNQVLKSLKIA